MPTTKQRDPNTGPSQLAPGEFWNAFCRCGWVTNFRYTSERWARQALNLHQRHRHGRRKPI